MHTTGIVNSATAHVTSNPVGHGPLIENPSIMIHLSSVARLTDDSPVNLRGNAAGHFRVVTFELQAAARRVPGPLPPCDGSHSIIPLGVSAESRSITPRMDRQKFVGEGGCL
jgi:hypothetical protein